MLISVVQMDGQGDVHARWKQKRQDLHLTQRDSVKDVRDELEEVTNEMDGHRRDCPLWVFEELKVSSPGANYANSNAIQGLSTLLLKCYAIFFLVLPNEEPKRQY